MVGPLQSEPYQPPKDKGARALPPILSSDPSPAPQEAAKKEKPKSVSGWFENLIDDGIDLAKGLYEILHSTVKSYQQNVPYILKNADALTPGMLFNWNEKEGEFKGAIPETAKSIIESVKQPYREHGASIVYHKPLTFAGDMVTILTLGGGSLKNAGKLAKAAGAGEQAERLIEAGKFLEDLPAAAARKGVDLTTEAATGGKLNLAKRREFLNIKGEEQGRRILKVEGDVENVVKKIDALDPAEKEVFHKARVLGDAPGVGVPDEMLTPKVRAALDSYGELVNKVDPKMVDHGITEFYKSRGLLNAETAENTLAKKFALEAFGDVSEANVAKARDLIAASARKPIYGQNVFVNEAGKTLSADAVLDDMITGGKRMRETKVAPLEAMKGAAGYSKDPSVYVREMIKNFRNTEAKARLSERLLESPKLIKGGAAAMDAKSIPEGIGRKYYEDPIRGEALKSITDPTIQRLLKWEYTKNDSSLVKLYDRMQSLFARSATMYNPKWVTGNVVGDGVLGLLAGSDWVEGMRQLKAGNMPGRISGKNVTLATTEITNPKGAFRKAVDYLPERAADVAGYVDQATRVGIVAKKAARDFKEAALSFEGSAVTFEDVLRSTDRFSDVQVQMRLLEERTARGSVEVVRRDRDIAQLLKREQVLHEKLEAIELKTQVESSQKLEANKGKIADAWRDTTEKYPTHVYGSEIQEQRVREATQGAIGKAQRLERDASLGAAGKNTFEKGMRKLDDVRQRIVNLTKERDLIVRDITDDLAKSGELERTVPGLRQQVDILRPAVERANAFVGDYLALDGFEQGVMRRIIPFYPWAKAMSTLAFRLPFIAPVKSFAWNRFSDALATLVNDPALPDDFKGRVPVAVLKDGRSVWVKLTTYSPFESLKTSKVAGLPVPQMFNLAERNPFIGLGFSFFGGKTVWDASSIPYGEQMVSIGDGTVLRVKPGGKIEREIPQTPLVSGVMHMFPSVQLVEQVLQPYWTNKYNWAGMPEPVLNADGSYKYPRELWDRLAAAVGVNSMTRDTGEVVRSRRIKAIKNVREMQKMYKRTQDPDEREFILDATKDYIKQELRGGK